MNNDVNHITSLYESIATGIPSEGDPDEHPIHIVNTPRDIQKIFSSRTPMAAVRHTHIEYKGQLLGFRIHRAGLLRDIFRSIGFFDEYPTGLQVYEVGDVFIFDPVDKPAHGARPAMNLKRSQNFKDSLVIILPHISDHSIEETGDKHNSSRLTDLMMIKEHTGREYVLNHGATNVGAWRSDDYSVNFPAGQIQLPVEHVEIFSNLKGLYSHLDKAFVHNSNAKELIWKTLTFLNTDDEKEDFLRQHLIKKDKNVDLDLHFNTMPEIICYRGIMYHADPMKKIVDHEGPGRPSNGLSNGRKLYTFGKYGTPDGLTKDEGNASELFYLISNTDPVFRISWAPRRQQIYHEQFEWGGAGNESKLIAKYDAQ
jgi:hypothetical protein